MQSLEAQKAQKYEQENQEPQNWVDWRVRPATEGKCPGCRTSKIILTIFACKVFESAARKVCPMDQWIGEVPLDL